MKRVLRPAGCVVVLSSAALAHDGATAVPAFSFWPGPLIAGLGCALAMALAVAIWLGLRLRKATRQADLLVQAMEQTPAPLVLFDRQLRVVRANAAARRRDGIRIGASLSDMAPGLMAHPLAAGMRGEAGPGASDPPGGADISGDLLRCEAAGESFLLWHGVLTEGARPGPFSAVNVAPVPKSDADNDAASANRMQSEFIANINHEVRTPMNAIIGYTEMLAHADLGAKEKRYAASIHKSSLALVAIFNDIMELSKIDSGRIQILVSTIRLATVVDEVEDLFMEMAKEKGVRLSCRIARHLPPAYVLDSVHLKQVLHNLIRHAFKHTREGEVELLVDGMASAMRPGCHDLRLIVRDTGTGLAAAELDRIRGLFSQDQDDLCRPYSGVGLGLTLCARLVAMMGGRIEVSANEERGTRFTVFLDGVALARQEPAGQPELAAPARPDLPRKKTILVVDDVDLIKDMFVEFFRGSPYTVLTAGTGEEALALAVREQPGMIFMDLNLAEANGRQVTGQLRRQPETAMIPVVVMTGEILEESEYRPLFDDLLQKPFCLERLGELVGRFVPVDENEAEAVAPARSSEEEAVVAALRTAWNGHLATLHTQAVRSGSLSDAAALGDAVLRRGMDLSDQLLIDFGADLRRFADEPDIVGVDRLLLELSKALQGAP